MKACDWKVETFDWKRTVVHKEVISLAKLKVNALNYYRNPSLNQLEIIENQQIRFLFVEINQVS